MSIDETGETEESWQERFRDALAQGNAKAVAKTLREVTSLDRSAIEALANLFEAGAGDHGAWATLYPHKLIFVRKRRGAPKDPEKEWVRDPQIVNSVEKKEAYAELSKTAIYDTAMEFKVGRTTICNAIALAKKSAKG